MIGVLSGVLAAGFTAVNLKFMALRRAGIGTVEWKRILEPVASMLIVASLTVGVSAAYGCSPVSQADPVIADKLVGLRCEEGTYNEVATLLYNSGNDVIKCLWSRHDNTGAGRDR